MNSSTTFQSKSFRIGLIALIILSLHILLCIYVLVAPYKYARNPVMNLYRQLVILGPFFAESRITYSHFLSVEFKANDTWSPPRQIGKEHFLAYVENPWQFNKLSYLGYERYLVTSVASLGTNRPFEEVQQGVAFRELNEVLMTEFIKTSVDSIRIVYGLNHYTPATGSYALDTVFIHTYNPDTIGKAKK